MTDPTEPPPPPHGPGAGPADGSPTERSLVISVGAFKPPAAAPVDEEAPSGFRPLRFAHDRSGAVAAALSALGHRLHGDGVLTDPALAETQGALDEALRATPVAGALVVHVLTHGHTDGQGGLYLAMTDSGPYDGLDVEAWLRAVEHRPDRPCVLLLLDVCHAGSAVDWQWVAWRTRLRAERRKAWVLAASTADEKAYQGRFSQAVAEVLRRIRADGLGADPGVEFVPVSLIAREIRRTLDALWRAEDGRPQHLDSTPLALGEEPALRLFRNPRYRSTPLARLRLHTEDSLRGFLAELDPVLDAQHYLGRAFGAHRVAERSVCLFTGRQDELTLLTPWVDGGTDDDVLLRVVTGGPGSGKSALLGMLVCAAHPDLRPLLVDRLPPDLRLPGRGTSFAAVHARGRGPAELAASLAGQLGLGAGGEAWTASDVVGTLRRRVSQGGAPAVIVVDALDEAAHVPDTVALLLLPLARARSVDRGRRRGGRPVCRLLVGTRDVPEAAPLLAEAHRHGGVLDLDAVSAAALRTDVTRYLRRHLERDPAYDTAAQAGLRGELSLRIAGALVPDARAPGPARGGAPGAYLLASLYLQHLLTAREPVSPGAVDRVVAEVPRDVPDVLALHLRQLGDAWARPVLTALSHAGHPGLPAELVLALAPLMDGAPAAGTDRATVSQVLTDLAFYLRRSVDTDGTTLYRLFHQELVDHLKAAPVSARAVHLALLAPLRPAGADAVDWALALPYHLRHLIEHAAAAGLRDTLLADPGFLAHADPAGLLRHLDAARSAEARELAGVYGMSADRHRRADPAARRSVMAVDAARSRNAGLVRRLTSSPGAAPAAWTPSWFSGRLGRPVSGTVVTTQRTVTALAVGESAGRPVALSTDGAALQLWDLWTGQSLGLPLTGHTRPVRAVALGRLGTRTYGLTGAGDAAVRLWDLEEQRPHGPALRGHRGAVTGVAFVAVDGAALVLSAATDGTLRLWDPHQGRPAGPVVTTGTAPVHALAVLDDPRGPLAVTADGDGAVRLWSLRRRAALGAPLPGAPERITYLAAAPCGRGRALVLAAGPDRACLWDVALDSTGAAPGDDPVLVTGPPAVLPAATGPVGLLPAAHRDLAVAVMPRAESLALRTLPDGAERVVGGHARAVTALATSVVDGRRVVLTGSQDTTIRRWYPDSPTSPPEHGHPGLVTALACGTVGGRRVAAVASDSEICLRDLTGGRVLRRLDTGHGIVTGVAFARTSRRTVLVSVGTDRAVRVTGPGGEPVVPPLTGHTGRVDALAVGRVDGGPVAVTGGVDHSIAVWDLRGRSLLGRHVSAHDAPVTGVAVAPAADGSATVVSCGDDRTVRLWRLTSEGLSPRHVIRHEGPVHSVALRPSVAGPVAVTVGSDHAIRLWDTTDGSPLGPPLAGHTAAVIGVAVGRCRGIPAAFTLGADATVRAWDLHGRRPLALLELPEPGEALAWAPGRGLLIGMGRDVLLLREASR
ncbi:WD40 repeat domain-containing protein [Streptomyces sp. MNP-20]|uniref:WD40 repeat domain-containing protein n=1 Tax=Streptomyces sp. MNP-20 TaxID=2721165 RepID=UPI0015533C3F|nr:WD40 repeat domain-containing protein [Streptomyces sp. MNP-20]